jgi:hypothetical protein
MTRQGARVPRAGYDNGIDRPPLDPAGKTADAVAGPVENWIQTEMHRLAPHRFPALRAAQGDRTARGTPSA